MSPGRHLRQPAHFPDTTAARRGRSTTSRTAVQDKLHALLDLNERNTQLEEQALKGRQTNEIAIKASADAVMLAANAVCCSRCCTKKKKNQEEVCLLRKEHEWKRELLEMEKANLTNTTFHELLFKQCVVHNPKSSRNYSVYRFLQKFLADSHFKSWRTIGSVVWRCGRDLCPLNWSSTFTRFAVVGTQVRHTCSTGRAHSSIKCRKPHPL